MSHPLSVCILGASGYTGIELVRLLLAHPHVKITALSADKQAGKYLHELFPSVYGHSLPVMQKIDEINFSKIDLVFCCLPHGTTHTVIQNLPLNLKVIDLSADFRLFDLHVYEKWYGAHHAPALQPSFVYGLTEHARDALKTARLVANPGCYPTASTLPLIPLLQQQAIHHEHIIIDAKSGVSGAGRALREGSLAAEVGEGFKAYSLGAHRHFPEITQTLNTYTSKNVLCTFSPHLLPMNRGILSTIYVRPMVGQTSDSLRDILVQSYAHEPFIQVLPGGVQPNTHMVRGSNSCHMNVFAGYQTDMVIIVSVIDNLVKGASGQAIQNMNVMYGFEETVGLPRVGVFP
jgi:N-acetyl-gamma-glutamyl-phosphate reductase